MSDLHLWSQFCLGIDVFNVKRSHGNMHGHSCLPVNWVGELKKNVMLNLPKLESLCEATVLPYFFRTNLVNLTLTNATSCFAMQCSGLALLALDLSINLFSKHPGSATHAFAQPRTIICQYCSKPALVLLCTDFDPVLLALPYFLTIPVARIYSWTSNQCPPKEGYGGNTTVERWGFPYNIRVGAEGLGFPARSECVPISTAFPW